MARGSSAPVPIGFLSDYGHADEFVGVCHGVIAGRCPGARVIDICHAVPRHDVRTGALMLRAALPYLPRGVALAVVDPGVGAAEADGGARRALALRSADEAWLLVGPDNGLLMAAAEHFGGVGEAVEVGGSPVRLRPASRTFAGRDIFAPVAAALAAGAPLHELGEPLDAPSPCTIELPRARAVDGILIAHVAHVDGFGNAALDATVAQLDDLCDEGAQVSVGAASGIRVARRADAFGDVAPGELLIHEDARGMVALAVNLGSAAELLGVVRDDELELMHP